MPSLRKWSIVPSLSGRFSITKWSSESCLFFAYGRFSNTKWASESCFFVRNGRFIFFFRARAWINPEENETKRSDRLSAKTRKVSYLTSIVFWIAKAKEKETGKVNFQRTEESNNLKLEENEKLPKTMWRRTMPSKKKRAQKGHPKLR